MISEGDYMYYQNSGRAKISILLTFNNQIVSELGVNRQLEATDAHTGSSGRLPIPTFNHRPRFDLRMRAFENETLRSSQG